MSSHLEDELADQEREIEEIEAQLAALPPAGFYLQVERPALIPLLCLLLILLTQDCA